MSVGFVCSGGYSVKCKREGANLRRVGDWDSRSAKGGASADNNSQRQRQRQQQPEQQRQPDQDQQQQNQKPKQLDKKNEINNPPTKKIWFFWRTPEP